MSWNKTEPPPESCRWPCQPQPITLASFSLPCQDFPASSPFYLQVSSSRNSIHTLVYPAPSCLSGLSSNDTLSGKPSLTHPIIARPTLWFSLPPPCFINSLIALITVHNYCAYLCECSLSFTLPPPPGCKVWKTRTVYVLFTIVPSVAPETQSALRKHLQKLNSRHE